MDKRIKFLNLAEKCICGDRQNQYGAPRQNFEKIASLWSAYLDIKITAGDVGVLLTLMKVARIHASSKEDNYVDAIGYLALAGEVDDREVPQEV